MQTRSKVVELSGRKFHLRKLSPEVGSFILMRMLGVSMQAEAARPTQPDASQAPRSVEEAPVDITGEMHVRAITFRVFSGGMGFEDFKFVQDNCMRAVSIVEERAGVDFPMPIMNDSGVWTAEGEFVAEDVGLVMRLTTEVLIFCFAGFFAASGPGLPT